MRQLQLPGQIAVPSLPPYRAPGWLPGGHLQTLWPLARRDPLPAYRRQRWDTPDGDFIDLDWMDGPPGAPLVVLFHGLEGSSGSHYARALMQHLRATGWSGVVVHFRGCSGEPNRLPRAYHSGDSAEIRWIVQRLRQHIGPARPLFAVGVSLGGNALLKWLGEDAGACGAIQAAAAICPPLDLGIAGHALGRGPNLMYTRNFLNSLKPKALAKLARHPDLADAAAIRRANTLYAFDNAYTAPVHGFRDTEDYWRRASSRPWLRHIRVPTLLLMAENDPFVPATALPGPAELSPAIHFECQREGGHVGFIAGPWPGHLGWLPRRLHAFFAARLAGGR
jgi:predicted alpha/beta-fold hydrolase